MGRKHCGKRRNCSLLATLQTRKNQGLFGKGLIISQTSPEFWGSAVQVFVGKGEIARYEQLVLFSQRFLTPHQVQNCRLQSLEESKTFHLGKG